MRQRKLRNLDQKYEAFEDLIVDIPSEMRGRWAGLAAEMTGKNNLPIYVEIGCGKGKFISELAEKEPDQDRKSVV